VADRRSYFTDAVVSAADLNGVDFDAFDRAAWPELDALDALPPLDRWRVLDALDHAGLVDYRGSSAHARLRLWRAGKRSDEETAAWTPHFVYAPPWVADLLRTPGGAAALLDPETAAAAEVAVLLAASEVDGMVAARALLAGEPAPADGGWRRDPPPKPPEHGTYEERGEGTGDGGGAPGRGP
jgi:hypothetical protein